MYTCNQWFKLMNTCMCYHCWADTIAFLYFALFTYMLYSPVIIILSNIYIYIYIYIYMYSTFLKYNTYLDIQ